MPEVEPGLGVFKAPKAYASEVMNRGRTLNSRYIPPIMPAVAALSQQTQVYIFNVGPWSHTQWMGSLGRYIIPGTPGGKNKKNKFKGTAQYSDALVIPGIVSELYPESESSMKRMDSDGYETALQILGIGAHMSPSNALTRYGVGVSRQWPPLKSEIDAAWQALVDGELEGLIREANSAAAQGPTAIEQTIRERHFEAARLLKKSTADCPWMLRSMETAERKECWACGEPMKVGLPRCPNCKEIVDQALYDQRKLANAPAPRG